MKLRVAKSLTADLFAAPAPRRPEVPPAIAPQARPAPISPAPQPRLKQLWYAAVFPGMAAQSSIGTLQKLCLQAHSFTPLVSIEPPNALLLEIKGSVKLFGSLQQLHADIEAHVQACTAQLRAGADLRRSA